MRTLLYRTAAPVVALFLLAATSASALTIREFKRFSKEQQAVFVSGAVAMAAYTYATGGDVPKARCIQQWFFGKAGEETPGPRAIAIEIGIAEQQDADKFRIEGVVLGTILRACPDSKSKP